MTGPAARHMPRGVLVAVLALGLAACQSAVDQINEQAFQPSNNPVTVDTVTRNDRVAELARQQHPRILATYGGEYSDPKLERMVAKVVGNLTLETDNPTQTYRITILNSPNVNAFALPGGYLYVTRGLLALANNSSELAAVIAHEMGHVTANHGVARQRKEAEEGLATRVVSDVLGNDQAAKAALVRGKLRLAQFSRNQELEADAIGIRTWAAPATIPMPLRASSPRWPPIRISARSAVRPMQASTSSPAIRTRRSASSWRCATRTASALPARGRDRNSFLAGIDGVLFGDTPEEGYVRGNTFLHPRLGISFSVPDGFIIDNTAAAVTATGPADTAVRFDAVELNRRTSLADYLRSGWVAGLDPASVRAETLNGNDAAFATARAEGWQFDIVVVRVGGQVYRLLTAAPAASTGLTAIARTVSGSFRTLSEGGRRR